MKQKYAVCQFAAELMHHKSITVGELRRLLAPHRADLPVVFVTDESVGGYPEWHGCEVRYDADGDILEVVLKDQRA